MHTLLYVALTAAFLGPAAVYARSAVRFLRTGTTTLGNMTCHRSESPLCFWLSMLLAVVVIGVLATFGVHTLVQVFH
jgi:hypothetical protein